VKGVGYTLSDLTTLQDAAEATADGTALNMKGYRTLTVQVSGTFTGTVTFEGTIDDTNWFAVGMPAAATGTAASTATAAGAFYLPDEFSLSQFRARVSAYTDGDITVTARRQG